MRHFVEIQSYLNKMDKSFPIMWSFMDHHGNSSTSQRIDLMKRYIDVFGVSSIQTLLGDREFVGDEWLTYFVENSIPFSIRLRKDMYIETEDGRRFQFSSLLQKKRNGRWKGWLCGMARTPENFLRFEGKNMGITCESAQVEAKAWQMPSGEWV